VTPTYRSRQGPWRNLPGGDELAPRSERGWGAGREAQAGRFITLLHSYGAIPIQPYRRQTGGRDSCKQQSIDKPLQKFITGTIFRAGWLGTQRRPECFYSVFAHVAKAGLHWFRSAD